MWITIKTIHYNKRIIDYYTVLSCSISFSLNSQCKVLCIVYQQYSYVYEYYIKILLRVTKLEKLKISRFQSLSHQLNKIANFAIWIYTFYFYFQTYNSHLKIH